MSSSTEKQNAVVSNESQELDENLYSIEVVRRCSELDVGCLSWEWGVSSLPNRSKDEEETPPFLSVMVTDDTSGQALEKANSTQTEPSIQEPTKWSEVSPITCLSSNSESSFKSINSNISYKIRTRRLKSDSNLVKEAPQRLRKSIFKQNYSETNTPGGTPKKERSNRTKGWRVMDSFWTWIGRKGYQSVNSELLREPMRQENEGDHSLLAEEIVKIKNLLDEVDKKHSKVERELREEMASMKEKMEQHEGRPG